jgi:replication factor A1
MYRFKLSVLAGDETGDTDFIIFGRQAHRLTKKTADTLIADNPSGFIPDEITRLLEKTFIWSVSFTESTIDSGNVTFQVNAVVGEINDGSATIPATPDGSQASSLMLSGGAGTSIQNTPQKSHALTLSSLPATSEPSLASSATPAKQTFPASEPPETPQSVRSNAHDKVNYSLLLYMLP